MNKVHARMIQKLAHENARLRNECEMLEEAIEEANEELERLKAASARAVVGLIESAGEEFQNTEMPPDVQESIVEWLNCLNPGVDNLAELLDPSAMTDEKEEEIWDAVYSSFDDEEEDDDTYYSPTNRISHLFDEENEA